MDYIEERSVRTRSGFAALLIIIAAIIITAGFMICVSALLEAEEIGETAYGILITLLSLAVAAECMAFAGLRVVDPNEALVLAVFGRYIGTIYGSGFYFVNPFATAIYPKLTDGAKRQAERKKKVSTKISTFVNGSQKVNDALGNPIELSAIVIWKVVNATQAVINVDNYHEYLSNQTDSTIRNIARLYPYDVVSDEERASDDELTLRGSSSKIASEMQIELQKKVRNAGIEIEEVKLNQIAYAPEIAAAMLQRQQATAIIAARKKIVEGAVSMVEMALDRLRDDEVVELDEERKAQMVSNLMVVLCSNKEASPIVNAGSIY